MPSNAKRKRKNFIQGIAVVVLLLVGVFAVLKFQAHSELKDKFKVTFETSSGETPAFYLEVAANNASRARGLMYRKPGELQEDSGMIFVFPNETTQSFWMKNTYISLDMLFIDKDFRVVGILADVPTLNQKPRTVGKPSTYVVELLAGTSQKYGITEGAKMKIFSPLPKAA